MLNQQLKQNTEESTEKTENISATAAEKYFLSAGHAGVPFLFARLVCMRMFGGCHVME
jgi:hypothetical protein